jgi:hypothetical protein
MRTYVALALVAACGTTSSNMNSQPTGGPRGLRANEHAEAARHHDEAARQSSAWPDSYGDRAAYNIPWVLSWDAQRDEERLAAIHRNKAAELHAEYAEACGDRTGDRVTVSPLQRYGVGGWNTSTGVIMYLRTDAGTPDQFMADMRCHRAWMMLAPAMGMENCALDLPGIKVDARGDSEGITLSITVPDSKLVEELHRRAAHELEASHVH